MYLPVNCDYVIFLQDHWEQSTVFQVISPSYYTLKPLRLVTFTYHLKMVEVAYHMLHLIMERATEWWETPSPLWILEYLQVLQKVFNNIVAIACLIYTLLKSVNHLPLLEACTAPFVTLWASSPNLTTPPSLDQLETSTSDESVPIHLPKLPS